MAKNVKPSCRLISIVNQKGGVGKSTSAINISAYLGKSGYRTLLVDMDPQSNATSGLGVYPGDIKNSTYDIIINFEIFKPHNSKVYNSVTIQKLGLEEWNKICDGKTTFYYQTKKIQYGGDKLTLEEKDPNMLKKKE